LPAAIRAGTHEDNFSQADRRIAPGGSKGVFGFMEIFS